MARIVNFTAFNSRIQLLRIQWKLDEELNRKEYLLPVADVFACIEEKSTAEEGTNAGYKPVKRLHVTIRKNPVEFEYIKHKNKLYRLTAPIAEVNSAYDGFDAEGIDANLPVITDYPEVAR